MALAGLLSGYGSSGEEEEEAAVLAPRDEQGGAAVGPSVGPAWPAGEDFEALPEAPEEEEEEAEERAAPDDGEEEPLCACAPAGLQLNVQLPAAPDGACEPALAAKLARFHSLLHAGRPGVNVQLRQRMDQRNPDYLQRAVDTFGVLEYGTAMSSFDPSALAEEDFSDALAAETRKAAEEKQRRAQTREAVEFVPAADGAAAKAAAAEVAAKLNARLGGQ